MDNVLNRPLFKRRAARDRLNDMAGVAPGYDVGGPVYADRSGAILRPQLPMMPMRPVRPAGVMSALEVSQPTMEEPGMQSILSTAARYQVPQAESALAMARRQFEAQRTPENYARVQQGIAALAQAKQQAESFGGQVLDIRTPPVPDPGPQGPFSTRGINALEGPEAMQNPGDIFSRLDRATDMEASARGRNPMPGEKINAPAPGAVEPTKEAAAILSTSDTGYQEPSDMEVSARGRAPYTLGEASKEIAAGLNSPKPEVREKTAQDFMKEFMDLTPKYEGADKNLTQAMIGFAIAAGDSPNAMQNIANGLLAGADMMLKDKAAKAEFDRQLQLSAAQYGLGEIGKLAEEKRLMEREGRNGSFFVASKDLTFNGRKYAQGENVFVPNSVIWEQGLPPGLQTESLADSLMTNKAALIKAASQAASDGTIKGEELQKTISALDDAAKDYSSASKLIPILEGSLIRVADGRATGISSAFTSLVNQTMNAFGVKPPEEYASREEYMADMEKVAAAVANEVLGESGKTISDNDRRMVANILASEQASFKAGVFKDPDIIISKIQELMSSLEGKQQRALDTYRTQTELYAGTTAPSGNPVRSYYADRVFNPPEGASQKPFKYVLGQDGKYIKQYLE